MQIRLAGAVNNILEAAREMRSVYDRNFDTTTSGKIGPSDLQFMVERIRRSDTRTVFLWLLDIVVDIEATAHWWKEAAPYIKEVTWLRKSPTDSKKNREIRETDFEGGIPAGVLSVLKELAKGGKREELSESLPDNFIRRGYAKADYESLRRLYHDRRHYHSGDWETVCNFLETVPYASLIVEPVEKPSPR